MRKHSGTIRKCPYPCPGCGATGQYRLKDEVCGRCFTLMEEGRQQQEEVERLKKLQGETALYDLGYAPHNYPYIRHADAAGREFQITFDQLARSLGRKRPHNEPAELLVPGSDPSFNSDTVELSVEHATLLLRLYQHAIAIAQVAYADGKNRGGNLLNSLARGEITINDYNTQSK